MAQHSSDDYMEQCPYCKKYLLARQVKEHVCDSPLSAVKEIPVVFFYETSSDNGNPLVIAMGFDGVLYRLVRCQNPLLRKSSSDDSYHEPSNRRKVNRTLIRILLSLM